MLLGVVVGKAVVMKQLPQVLKDVGRKEREGREETRAEAKVGGTWKKREDKRQMKEVEGI